MIPILFDKTETAFISNGIGRLRDCISCIVTEERNGIYECDFEYPMGGANFDQIQVGRIIGITHDESGDIEPFDIVSYSKPIQGIVTFHCTHLSYRLSYKTVTGTNINSLADAFTLFESAEPDMPFSFGTDKTSTGYLASADGLPHSVRQMMGGIEGSILDAYGGEYQYNNWLVYLHESRGVTRDFAIRYGVNMLEYNEDYNTEGTYSSCIPYWTDGTTSVVGDRVDASGVTITGRGECVPLDVSDKFESQPTKAQVEAAGLAYMTSNNTFIPAQNIHVEFVRLQDLGYENLGSLMQCNLCDTIQVIFPDYNSSGMFKIVKTEWNVLKDRYESMELGDLSLSLSQALGISNALEGSGSGQAEVDLRSMTSTGASVSLKTSNQTLAQTIERGTTNHGFTTSNNGGVIIPKTGYYLLSGTWIFNSLTTTANTLTVAFRVWDGSTTTDMNSYGHGHTGAYCIISVAPRVYYLSQGHVVFQVARNNTSARGNCSGAMTLQYLGT